MFRMRLDTREWQRKARAMAQASPAARKAAVKLIAVEVVKDVVVKAPRDTCRFVRGWGQALNASGAGSVPLPALKTTGRYDQYLRALTRQLRKWDFIVKRYERGARRDKWYRRAVRNRDKALEQLRRFDEGGETAILINKFRTGRFEGGMTTVRHKVYGGEGHIVDAGDRSYVYLRNLEPHATFVEMNTAVLKRSIDRFRGSGLHRVTDRYVRAAAARAGVRVA